MSLIKSVNLQSKSDERGSLVIIEELDKVPFEIKRVYYLYGMQSDLPRGFHAHKECVQVAVCIQGSCKMHMDNGQEKGIFTLDNPSKGLVIDTFQWHEMHDFSSNCILMVLASQKYDENDYIRDYKEFVKVCNNDS